MRRLWSGAVLLALTVGIGGLIALPGVPAGADTRRAAPAPVRSLEVSGEGVSMFPEYRSDVTRYAVQTDETTDGTVTVSVGTGPEGSVRINGLPAPGGTRELTGLAAGDEIAVFLRDARGSRRLSLVYLPEDFPALERVRTGLPDTPSPGHVMLTLGKWVEKGPFFETAVDANGVPVYVHREPASAMDLKPTLGGHYLVGRNTSEPGRAGSDIVELNEQFREVRRTRTVGLTHTDAHDSILLPDGSMYLLAYEPNAQTGLTDAVIQHVSVDGEKLFEWNSADHLDIPAETVVEAGDPDYAHINSLQVMADGDLLASFRHLDAALKIVRHPHDGYAEGDVVWRWGGRRSDWTFVDQQGLVDDGPCAQHTVYQLENGHLLVFDNSSATLTTALCVRQSDPDGPVYQRLPTRITEWALDEETGTATMVWNFQERERFAVFAGSAQRLDNGNTVVGWASSTVSVASEIDPQGQMLWDLKYAGDSPKWFTYRAHKAVVPDRIAPRVSPLEPESGTTYTYGAQVAPLAECTDTGGSTLQMCRVPAVDTSTLGTHEYTVTARDGEGNRSSKTVQYRVVRARHQPDAEIRSTGGFVGGGVLAGPAKQRVGLDLTRAKRTGKATVRVTNVGKRRDRVRITPLGRSSRFRVRYVGLPASGLSPVLAPGSSWTFKVRVTRLAKARRNDTLDLRLRAASKDQPTHADTVGLRVRARG